LTPPLFLSNESAFVNLEKALHTMLSIVYDTDFTTKGMLAKCLNRVDLLHADAAKTRSEIITARDTTLAQLEECLSIVRARSAELLTQLDAIETRQTAVIETAIVAAERLEEDKEDDKDKDDKDKDDKDKDDDKEDKVAIRSLIRASRMFYAIESTGKVDWSAIRNHGMRLFEFHEFPVIDSVRLSVDNLMGTIQMWIPDSVMAWGTPAARATFIKNSMSIHTREGPTKYTLEFTDNSVLIKPAVKPLHNTTHITLSIYFSGKQVHEPVTMMLHGRCERWDSYGVCEERARSCPHFHGHINRVCRYGDMCRHKDLCPARHPRGGGDPRYVKICGGDPRYVKICGGGPRYVKIGR